MNNTKLSNQEVKELLGTSPIFCYYMCRSNKGICWGFLLGFGTGFIITDLVTAASQDKVYPSALTYIGLTSALVSIPIIIGHTKKIKQQ
jgi:hypothetical protein